MKKILLVVLVVIAGAAGGLLVSTMNMPCTGVDLSGGEPAGGDFDLIGEDGPVSLQNFRGKVVLIYLGYTFCPDICPTSLALMTQVLNEMSETELAQVQPIFISVDPARDSPEKLVKYTDYFHESILGVTGTAEDIADVASRYGAVYRKVEGESEGGYLIDHTSVIHVIGTDGVLSTSLPHGTAPTKILDAVRARLPTGSG